MVHRILRGVVVGTACSAATILSASAAEIACCAGRFAAPPVPYAVVAAPPQFYVVNQGPVYSGPNIFTVPRLQENVATFTPYPYAVTYAPYVGGYGRPPLMRYRPRLRAHRSPPPRFGAYASPPPRELAPRPRDFSSPPPRLGETPPPLRRPPPPPHVAPRPGPRAPEAAPPVPPQRPDPKKPVEEQWTRGVPN